MIDGAHDVAHDGRVDEAAAAAAAVVHQAAEQAEDRRRRAKGHTPPPMIGSGGMMAPASVLRWNPTTPADGVDDDHPGSAVMSAVGGPELTQHHHVEQDVQTPRVQPAALRNVHQRPEPEHRGAPLPPNASQWSPGLSMVADPAPKCSRRCRREKEGLRCKHRCNHEDHDGDEPEVVAELPQRPPVAPQAGIPPSARVTFVVVHADERAARGTDHRTGALSFEHLQELINEIPRRTAWLCRSGAAGETRA